MTEAEWLASDDPSAMLEGLRREAVNGAANPMPRWPSDRKLRLFAVACCRAVWDGTECPTCGDHGGGVPVCSCRQCNGTGRVGGLTDPRSRAAVEVAERYADGLATVKECREYGNWTWHAESLHRMLSLITRQANPPTPPPPGQASLLREIVGNPFRDFRPTRVGRTLDNWWSDPTVLRLARAIYDERRFDELAVLADALEDAGCADAVILAHLRGKERCQRCAGHGWYHDGPRGGQRSIQHCGDCDGTGWIALRGPHVRGCWAPDLVLGKA